MSNQRKHNASKTKPQDKKKELEKRDFEHLKKYLLESGHKVEGEMHEPNGYATFPDFFVKIDGIVVYVEVTQLGWTDAVQDGDFFSHDKHVLGCSSFFKKINERVHEKFLRPRGK